MAAIVKRNFSKGDRLRPVQAKLLNQDGTPVDLTANTVVFRMVKQSDSTVKVNNQSATIVSATNGEVKYDWVAADVDTAADYWAWFIRTSGGLTEHFPAGKLFQVTIEPNQ